MSSTTFPSLPFSSPLFRALESNSHPRLPTSWYVLRLRTSLELMITEHLKWRSIPHFLPTQRLIRRYPNTTHQIITKALFPGYCFARFTEEERLLVDTTPGVISVLQSSPGVYAEVSDREVQDIYRMSNSDIPVTPWSTIQSGRPCRVIAGPLTGTQGVLMKYKDMWHVVLNIHLFGRACSVVIERENVVEED